MRPRFIIAFALLLLPLLAHANQPRLALRFDGGVADFPGGTGASSGPAYGAAFDLYAPKVVALEFGYLGAAYSQGGNVDVVQNGAYGGVRLGLPQDGTVRPYVLGGVGFSRMAVSQEARAAGLNDDNLTTAPIAAGVDFQVGSFFVGARATYSIVFTQNSAVASSSGNQVLGTLGVGASL